MSVEPLPGNLIMNIQLQTQGFDVTSSIEEYVRKQLHFNLANFETHVISVDVYLRDINGPKGGDDKKALIRIRLDSGNVVTVERTRPDLYAAIFVAARQAKRSVRRKLRKHRYFGRIALRHLHQD